MIGQPDVLKPRSSGSCQEASTLKLISALCNALKLERVTYCHWKSNDALDRSATGDNDLDLLILNEHVPRFAQVLCSLDFKQALAPRDQSMPGVVDYYGYDKDTGRIVHVHAHFRLVVGDDRAKNYRLPIEKAYLAKTSEELGFQIPQAEFEFVLFVIRMMLKHCSWDAVLAGKGRLKAAVRSEFAFHRTRVDMSLVNDLLTRHMPLVDASLFTRCVQSLEPDASLWSRVSAAWGLQKALAADTRRPYLANVVLKAWRGFSRMLRRRLGRRMRAGDSHQAVRSLHSSAAMVLESQLLSLQLEAGLPAYSQHKRVIWENPASRGRRVL